MRLNYYQFDETISEATRKEEGCTNDYRTGELDDTLYGISISHAKELLKKYGGRAWTEHCERDGSVFEVTPIQLKGNNSKFTYNRHL